MRLLPVQARTCRLEPMDIKLAIMMLMLALLPILCIMVLVGRLFGLTTLHITVYLLALVC